MKRVLLLLILVKFIISCSNDSHAENNINEKKYYAVGSKYSRTKENYYTWVASIWIDGVPTLLSNSGTPSVAKALAFYNNDIYITGTESTKDGNDILKLWKNNVEENLTDGSDNLIPNDIAVHQGNVYIVGNSHSVATIWKNGKATYLSNKSSEANAIFIYNDNVYVTGNNVVNNKHTAVVWKDGVETILYSEEDNFQSTGTDIYVDDKNIYVTGYLTHLNQSIPIIWKNNIATTLSNPDINKNYQANALFVYNSDVYVCGFERDINYYDTGKIWKNGILIKDIIGANPTCIIVNNNKIFTAGFGLPQGNVPQEAKIWESNVEDLKFVEKYRFPLDEINDFQIK